MCIYVHTSYTYMHAYTYVISVVLHYKNTKSEYSFNLWKLSFVNVTQVVGKLVKFHDVLFFHGLTTVLLENNYQPPFTSTVHSSISAITGQTEESGPKLAEAFYEVHKEHWRIIISKLWTCLTLIFKSAHVHELHVNIYFSGKGILKHTSVSHVRLSFVIQLHYDLCTLWSPCSSVQSSVTGISRISQSSFPHLCIPASGLTMRTAFATVVCYVEWDKALQAGELSSEFRSRTCPLFRVTCSQPE